MFKFSPASRIALGLTGLASVVLTLGLMLNLVPDHRETEMKYRISVCEVLAGDGRVYIRMNDLQRWEGVLQLAVSRCDSLVSAGVRDRHGKLIIEVGNHKEHWPASLENERTGEYVYVPIRSPKGQWGQIELRYSPLYANSRIVDFVQQPMTRLCFFFGSLSFLFFRWFLRRILTQLDPSHAVPKRVSKAYDSLAGGVVVLDSTQKIVLANTSFTDMTGTDRQDLVGRTLDTLHWRGKDDQAVVLPWSTAHDLQQADLGKTLRVESPLGERIVVVNAAPIISNDDVYRGLLVGFEDVTPLEEAKEQLESSQQAAEAANVAKSEFLANMSHEIRTPMNSILGFAEILRRGFDDDPDQKQEYLNIIHSSGQHLLDLINDILDLSKVESGHIELEHVPCRPHEIANDVINVFRVKCQDKSLSLTLNIEDRIPETIIGDPTRIRQILTNLVGNAIKFTDQGGVSICARYDDSQQALEFDVVDSGIGISEDKLQKIFDPFSQADSSTTRKFGGTGLGLSISRKLTRLMGGELTATSVVGEGTTFTATFSVKPAADTAFIDNKTAHASIKQLSHAKGQIVELPPGRVLLVEDGASNRKLIELILRRAGCQVDSAENGAIGIDMAFHGDYDVILMDMQMPVMDGFTATKKLREAGFDLPIVAMTANAMKEDEELCIQTGCSHFIPKPVDMDLLVSRMAELLETPSNSQTMEITRRIADSVHGDVPTDDYGVSALPSFDSPSDDAGEEGNPPSGQTQESPPTESAHPASPDDTTPANDEIPVLAKPESVGMDEDPTTPVEHEQAEGVRTASQRLMKFIQADGDDEHSSHHAAEDLAQPSDSFHQLIQESQSQQTATVDHDPVAEINEINEINETTEVTEVDNMRDAVEDDTTPDERGQTHKPIDHATAVDAIEEVASIQGLADLLAAEAENASPDEYSTNPVDRLSDGAGCHDTESDEIVFDLRRALDEVLTVDEVSTVDEGSSVNEGSSFDEGSMVARLDDTPGQDFDLDAGEASFECQGSDTTVCATLRGDSQDPSEAVPAPNEPVEPAWNESDDTFDSYQPDARFSFGGMLASTLPMDDEDFRSIVVEFKQRAIDQCEVMVTALESEDWPQLSSLAHWLKGSGGTAGFPILTDLAIELELAAFRADDRDCKGLLIQLCDLLERIDEVSNAQDLDESTGVEVSIEDPCPPEDAHRDAMAASNTVDTRDTADDVADTPDQHVASGQGDLAELSRVESSLPMSDEEFRAIVREFGQRLEERIAHMKNQLDDGDLDELATTAHWLKGAGGTAGFPMLTEVGTELEVMAKAHDMDGCRQQIQKIKHISDSLHVPL